MTLFMPLYWIPHSSIKTYYFVCPYSEAWWSPQWGLMVSTVRPDGLYSKAWWSLQWGLMVTTVRPGGLYSVTVSPRPPATLINSPNQRSCTLTEQHPAYDGLPGASEPTRFQITVSSINDWLITLTFIRQPVLEWRTEGQAFNHCAMMPSAFHIVSSCRWFCFL